MIFPSLDVRFLLASIAHTTHCLPKTSANSVITLGFSTADVLTDTLSAPLHKTSLASGTLRTPPPTVKGILIALATPSTTPRRISRFSDDAVISRKTNSSAPSSEYRLAISTGSPACFGLRKFMHLTTLPWSTSKHGMIRFANGIFRPLFFVRPVSYTHLTLPTNREV